MRDVVVSAGVALLLAACAQAGQSQPAADASIGGPSDSRVDARADAMTVLPPDAYQCTTMTMQLLQNAAFDLDSAGTGWVQQPTDASLPLVTPDDGVVEHTAPNKVWLGGLEAADYLLLQVTDSIYQDVAIPAGTMQLTLTGQFDVRTSESDPVVYDAAEVVLTQTNGTLIDTVLTASNATPKTGWTPFSKTFATTSAGQTVRLRMSSVNDEILPTSFFFDSFALTATVCQ
jgi:hypothetical protein